MFRLIRKNDEKNKKKIEKKKINRKKGTKIKSLKGIKTEKKKEKNDFEEN